MSIYSHTIHQIDLLSGYIRRWLQFKGVSQPGSFSAEIGDGIAVVEGRTCRTCSEVADALNAYFWVESASNRLTIEPDELVPQDLSVPRAPLRASDYTVINYACNAVRGATLSHMGNLAYLRMASDPPLSAKSFIRVHDLAAELAALETFFIHGNWSTGTAAILGTTAFIELNGGAGEYLVLDPSVGSLGAYSAEAALRSSPTAVEEFFKDLHELRVAAA